MTDQPNEDTYSTVELWNCIRKSNEFGGRDYGSQFPPCRCLTGGSTPVVIHKAEWDRRFADSDLKAVAPFSVFWFIGMPEYLVLPPFTRSGYFMCSVLYRHDSVEPIR